MIQVSLHYIIAPSPSVVYSYDVIFPDLYAFICAMIDVAKKANVNVGLREVMVNYKKLWLFI